MKKKGTCFCCCGAPPGSIIEMVAEKRKDAATIARFHKTVLNWDYFDLRRESDKKNRKDAKGGASRGLKKVRETYKDVYDYLGVFEPLLFEEVKAQIVQGRNEEDDVQDYTGQKPGVVITCAKDDEFYSLVVCYNSEDGGMIAENDLLLLSNEKVQNEEGSIPHTAFAFVLNREGRDHLKLLTGEYCPSLLKQCATLAKSDDPKKLLWIMKIASLSTIVREYVGLRSIISLPFKELILSATENVSTSDDRSLKIPKPLMEYFDSNQNASQLDAIRAGLSRQTFVLIQGPPGTGKTQTILGILSAILHSTPARVQSKGGLHDRRRGSKLDIHEKYNHWKLASPWLYDTNPRDKIMPVDGDDGFFPTTGNDLRPEVVDSNRKYRVRVLVCAPSNSALDEIVLRVLSTGIRDENGRAYNPKIVRIGLKPHHSVQTVSMDYIVEQKLSGQDNTSADAKKRGATGDRDSIRASVLDEAAIVFSTLSFSGSSLFSKLNHVFDVVIIDEAAQAVEPATLVPLSNGCKQVFLVGDPLQLPATVISPTAASFGYDMSLFKRFQRAGYPVQMLKTQYRMHPEIRYFPSREFYSGALEDGPDVRIQTERAWHAYRCFGPFAFFDIAGVESKPSQSWVNVDEVEFILLMYHKLVSIYPELKSSSRLAIISPYREQVKLFRDRFRTSFGVDSKTLVDINTIDGFQGRETDVAIFSCVRAGHSIGFVGDARRMNVGITRARSSVLVVGSATTLKRDPHWAKLVESAEERDCLFKVSKPYAGFVSDENLETLRVKEDESMIDAVQSHLDEMEGNAVMYGDGEQGQGDDDDYGYGDGDGDDGGFGED